MRYGWVELLLVAVFAYTPVIAQPAGQLTPVDQAVADLDPLSTSLREVTTGLRADGESTSLFEWRPSQDDRAAINQGDNTEYRDPVFYRIGPGFSARVRRLDYVVRFGKEGVALNIKPRIDGEFVELIAADTIFELKSPSVPLSLSRSETVVEPNGRGDSATVLPSAPSVESHGRVDWQQTPAMDPRIDGRIDGRVQQQLPPDLANPGASPWGAEPTSLNAVRWWPTPRQAEPDRPSGDSEDHQP